MIIYSFRTLLVVVWMLSIRAWNLLTLSHQEHFNHDFRFYPNRSISSNDTADVEAEDHLIRRACPWWHVQLRDATWESYEAIQDKQLAQFT